jgi:recombination protein RecR
MDSIEKLAQLFEKFPGIGPRQARRFVQYLLVQRQGLRSEIAESIKQLGTATSQCKQCFRWFVKTAPKSSLCNICSNSHREAGILFVVEKDADIDNVERSGFKGLYFVLGGTIALASEEPQKHIRLKELISRIERDGTALKLNELILGLSATTEGDHTRQILQEKIRPMSEGMNFKLSSLGRGLSTGSELEYADPDTIANALSSRQ